MCAADGALRQAAESAVEARRQRWCSGTGATGNDRNEFAPLLDRAAGGLATGVLAKAIEDRGWRIVRWPGSIESVSDLLRNGRPVIVLLKLRNGQFHYVVVIGTTGAQHRHSQSGARPARSMPSGNSWTHGNPPDSGRCWCSGPAAMM